MKLTRMQVTAMVFIGGPVAVLLLGVLVLAIMISLSGDLEPVKVQARADGLQTDWSDPRWDPDAEHAVAAAELAALAHGVVFHAGSHGFSRFYFDGTGNQISNLGQPGSVIPSEIRNHYESEPPPWRAGFSAWRQRYLARPMRFAHPADPLTWETLSSLRGMMNWISYRILLSEEASSEEVLDLLDICDLMPFDFGEQAKIRWGMLVRVATLLHLRQGSWGDHLDILVAALQERRVRMDDEYRHTLQGQFIHVCVLIERDPHDVARDLGIAVPGWFESTTAVKIAHRLGRVDLLDRHRAVTIDLLASPSLMSRLLQTPTGCWDGSGRVHITTLAGLPAGLIDDVFNYERNAWITWLLYHQYCLTIDLAIADLSGKPWPPDSMDPAGAPLTPWNESGVVVGAISVGPDGLPGTQDDWRLRLSDPPLPSPAATDAPPLPAAAPTPHPTP